MSAILSADDLNDFISPGLACIKPVEVKNPSVPKKDSRTGEEELEIQIDIDGNATEINKEGTSSKLQQAQISLADCLACSGCITSAEEVLMAQHSHKELINVLKNNGESDLKKVFVMSISHQSRCSLAGALNLTIEQIDKFLIHLFVNNLGFTNVVGTGLGRKISNLKISNDLITRKNKNTKIGNQSNGPILSSVCPGWVLYAEKTHPYILPFMNTVKSPQQITGHLLKKLTSLERQIDISQVYHLSIMPCFDKKLEAARPEKSDNDNDDENTTNEQQIDVDCVITPKELIQLLQEENIDIDSLLLDISKDTTDIKHIYERYAPNGWLNPVSDSWMNDEGSSSGGYGLQYLLNLKEKLMIENGKSNDDYRIDLITGRNTDISELRLVDLEGNNLGSSGIVNGFKNIQNLVRKLKLSNGTSGTKKIVAGGAVGGGGGGLAARRRARELAKKGIVESEEGKVGDTSGQTVIVDVSKCDFVEVMACPGGCINGGGQITGPSGSDAEEWIQEIRSIYNSIPISTTEGEKLNSWVEQFLERFSVEEDRLIRTYFKEVEKPKDTASIALGSKW
ncbi:hypothetical protein CANARDRAFT_28927 [[Candida] arabinofermentans NRRL YB-2248]|uniref:Cytosolic Fe-S cluster assembly factor NAR1 n=1 Tax=[Candida] arabinofermentans NRRL YB-2248 TaxID=983967 RepID=A0A1E4SZ60_9ASCO|nr:hypothetical protein CANARDRAFT_28927 [[Candida] arabinofermentans NRRL YB-2248]